MQLNFEDNYINEPEGCYYSFILNGVLSFYISLYLFLRFKPIFKNEFIFKFKFLIIKENNVW